MAVGFEQCQVVEGLPGACTRADSSHRLLQNHRNKTVCERLSAKYSDVAATEQRVGRGLSQKLKV